MALKTASHGIRCLMHKGWRKFGKVMLCKSALMVKTAGYEAQLKVLTMAAGLPEDLHDIDSNESTTAGSTALPPHPDGVDEAPNAEHVINATMTYINRTVPPWEQEVIFCNI